MSVCGCQLYERDALESHPLNHQIVLLILLQWFLQIHHYLNEHQLQMYFLNLVYYYYHHIDTNQMEYYLLNQTTG